MKRLLLNKMGAKLIDITGKRFGSLVVHKYLGNKRWECLCDCGNFHPVYKINLRNGNVKSCGCYKRPPRINITDQRFGKLIANKFIGDGNWECLCDCGNFHHVLVTHLRDGTTKSCGCIKRSYGEELIESILLANGFTFTREKRFIDCRNVNPLPFDFSVIVNGIEKLIEFQGKHHYMPNRWGKRDGEDDFPQRQINDKIKTDWCGANGKQLLLIPYWEIDNIKTILIDFLST